MSIALFSTAERSLRDRFLRFHRWAARRLSAIALRARLDKAAFTKRVLITVSGTVPQNISAEISEGLRPRADYLELARGLNADILDHAKARVAAGRFAPILERLGGGNLLLAYVCWRLRGRFELILTDGEQVGLPLAALMKFSPGYRPRHFMITHVISVPKKTVIIDLLRLHTSIDGFVVYSRWQKRFIQDRWRVKGRSRAFHALYGR